MSKSLIVSFSLLIDTVVFIEVALYVWCRRIAAILDVKYLCEFVLDSVYLHFLLINGWLAVFSEFHIQIHCLYPVSAIRHSFSRKARSL